ncbi:MAG: hypothetical protein SVZ03_14775 [Spirochaetota bacterium]|nr:hypothetical protein [Spirochaetota bacterium]
MNIFNIKTYKIETLLTGITISIVILMVFFNDINKHIRIKELKIFLQRSNREDNNLDHIGLVMKYRLQKRLYEDQITQTDVNMTEMRVNAILSEETIDKRISLPKYKILSIPAVSVINFFRSLIRKSPIRDLEEDKSNLYLDISYYYERNKYYTKALELYEKALGEGGLKRTKIAGIFLHQGFCHSILGNYKEAREKYITIIKEYGEESIAVTAAILLRYLDGFRSEVERVLNSESDSLGKGEKLYKLIAYKESIDVLKKIEKGGSASERSRVQFFKGRCLEELAQKEEAVETYQKIIMGDYKSRYAKLANSRIYIIGSLVHNGSKIKQLAVKNNELIKDVSFTKAVSDTSEIYKSTGIENSLTQSTVFKDSFMEIDKNFSSIDDEKLKSYDNAIKKIDEKIEEEKKRKLIGKIKRKPVKIKVYTDDGNVFVGRVVKETRDYMRLKTIIGGVKINKNKIIKREKLKH